MADVTPTQLRIFVSHSHQNNDACRALVNALRGAGADVWYDEHNMTSGKLGATIERELRARPVFIVMLSPAALASSWVEDETRWAYILMRKNPTRIMLPVVCEAVPEDDIWLFLQEFKRVVGPDGTPFPTKKRHQQTLRALALTPLGETPTPVTPQPGEDVDDLLTRGGALSAQKRFADALRLFQRATNLDANNADAWFFMGDALADLGRNEKAIEAYDRALALEPGSEFYLVAKGLALEAMERYEKALAQYEKAIALNPNYGIAWGAKADVLDYLGRHAEAAKAKRQAEALKTEP